MIVLLVLLSASLGAINSYGALFMSFEPSSINRAIGGDVVGCVNIWHNNPLTGYANPAIPAFFNGLSFGTTKDKWLENSGLEGMSYNASLLSYGGKGFSILVPMPNQEDQFGITMNYGKQLILNEGGNELTEMTLLDNNQVYGVALNPFETFRARNTDYPEYLSHIDVAIGARLNLLRLQYPWYDYNSDVSVKKTAKAESFDMGGIARLNYTLLNTLSFEGVYGLSYFNVGKDSIKYGPYGSDMIWRHQNTGWALAASIKAAPLLDDSPIANLRWFDNLASFRYLVGKLDPLTDEDEVIEATGYELGLFDTVYLRQGHYDDPSGHIVGDTTGWGVNLHYKKLISFSYNYAEFPGGDLQKTQTSADYAVSIDFMRLGAMFR